MHNYFLTSTCFNNLLSSVTSAILKCKVYRDKQTLNPILLESANFYSEI